MTENDGTGDLAWPVTTLDPLTQPESASATRVYTAKVFFIITSCFSTVMLESSHGKLLIRFANILKAKKTSKAMGSRCKVRLGGVALDESKLSTDIRRVKRAVETWARANDYWFDTSFHDQFDYRPEAPRLTDGLLLISEGPICHDLGMGAGDGECGRGFEEVLAKYGFTYEVEEHFQFRIFPEDEKRQEEYLQFQRWRWIQRLAKKRLYEIHTEVFEHFAQRPEDLQLLGWRQYEEFLDAVFKNQGYVTEIGPGSNDGGVDLRLYQSAAVPELVTLVQARRYRQRPIKLEAVAALYGHAVQQKAAKGILATTSYFQPKAEAFARSVESAINLPALELVDARKTGGWCAEIATHLENYFRTGSNTPHLVSDQAPGELVGKVVVANGGHDMTFNYFAVIETEFRHEVILRPVGSRRISGDRHQGEEVAEVSTAGDWAGVKRFTAFKSDSGERAAFRGGGKYFSLWNGCPRRFNYVD